MKIDVALYKVILKLRILVPTVPGSTTSKGLVKDEGRGEYHATTWYDGLDEIKNIDAKYRV